MGAIFVSYRRGDSEGQARALFNELAELVGKNSVFMDVDSIALGRDFRQVLQERLGSCDLMLALIGPDWLEIKDASGNRRLENPTDFVRQEIAAALGRNIPVTPVLLRGAHMPVPEQLPDDLKDLAYRNGFELSHTRWDSDVREMIKRLGLGKADLREPQQGAIAAPGAGHPVADVSGSGVAGRRFSSMSIAISAGVTLLLLVSLAVWAMSGGDAQSAHPPTKPVTNETPVSARPESTMTIKSVVLKDGGTSGTQRSSQLDHQETLQTTGTLKMEFELSRGACSKVRLHIFIDGKPVRQTEFIDDTTGLLDLGPVSSGRHTLTLSPEGQLGGCNSGTLGSWGGALTLQVGT